MGTPVRIYLRFTVLYFPSKVHIIKNGQISYRVGLGQHCRRRCCEEGNVRCQPMARLDHDNHHYHHYHHHYHYHSQLYMGRLDHHHCSHHHHHHHHPRLYLGRLDHHQGDHHHHPSFFLGRLDFYHD